MKKNGNFKVTIPTTIVIFGVTGDLSRRKLLPALLDLFVKGCLPPAFNLVGFSRRDWDDATFKQFVRDVFSQKRRHPKRTVERFIRHLSYQYGQLGDVESYQTLSQKLDAIDAKGKTCANKLFYLAVPPDLYGTIFDHLAQSKLVIGCHDQNGQSGGSPRFVKSNRRVETGSPRSGVGAGWTKILVEKPFGRDIATAQQLDGKLGSLFDEAQIFRIDHYLAKETIQNILMFRFSNALFEPIWNNKYIERVEIKLHETLGVEGRGNFYQDVGALRDVGQNHILQMLAAIAMEEPGKPDSAVIRSQRVRALQALRPIDGSNIARYAVRGQYAGFKREPDIPNSSTTETYFRLEAYVDRPRWQGVPFFLESGKKMQEEKTEITIFFRKTICSLCPPEVDQSKLQNVLTFRVQPDEGIKIVFWAKKPGLTLDLEPTTLAFTYREGLTEKRLPDAYEQVLFDCIKGDQMRFISTEEVQAAWNFITPIVRNWKKTKLYQYQPGSLGPNLSTDKSKTKKQKAKVQLKAQSFEL